MSHYSTLQDYQFEADVKDIRGAVLYGPDQNKIGTMLSSIMTTAQFDTSSRAWVTNAA
jgi:hypothetical protein